MKAVSVCLLDKVEKKLKFGTEKGLLSKPNAEPLVPARLNGANGNRHG